jgi:hypothetical protein
MITVYIASPYTQGDAALNLRASLMAADKLVSHNFVPYCPLLSHFWHFLSPKSYDVWMDMDLEWVRRCDCLLRLSGDSSGADAEVALAQELGKPVFYFIADLIANMHEI